MAEITQTVTLAKGFNNLDRRTNQVWGGDAKRFFLGQMDQTGESFQYPIKLDGNNTDIFPDPTIFGQDSVNPLVLFRNFEGHYVLLGKGVVGSAGISTGSNVTLFSLASLIKPNDILQGGTDMVIGLNDSSVKSALATSFSRVNRIFTVNVPAPLAQNDTLSFNLTLHVTTALLAAA